MLSWNSHFKKSTEYNKQNCNFTFCSFGVWKIRMRWDNEQALSNKKHTMSAKNVFIVATDGRS